MTTLKLKLFLGGLLAKRIDVWFFYGFLITFPLSIRKVLTFYPVRGTFNEYTGIYLYLSDLFLLTTLALWGISILCNNWHNLSTISISWLKESLLAKKWLNIRISPMMAFSALLVIWSFISINWSTNQPIATFRAFKLLEFFLLYLYIRLNFKDLFSKRLFHVEQNSQNENSENCSTPVKMFHVEHSMEQARNNTNSAFLDLNRVFRNFILIFIGIGLFNALLAFLQIVNNGSIGLQFLKESIFNLNMIGVAKIILGNKPFIRPYGLFPHPNILGAYLLVSTMLTFWYFRLNTPPSSNCSTWNKIIVRFKKILSYFRQIFSCEWKIIFPPRIDESVPRGTISDIKNMFCSTWNIFCKISFFQKLNNIFSHSKLIVPRGTSEEPTAVQSLNLKIKADKIVPRGTISAENSGKFILRRRLNSLIWLFPLFALFLTFSKNAIIGLLVAFLIISFRLFLNKNDFNMSFFASIKPFLRDKLVTKRNILITAIILMVLFNIRPSLESFIYRSIDDRLVYQNVSRGTISENFILGVGMGQFIPTMDQYSKMPLLTWQYQPVHNVFSLIWSELGLIGLLLFIAFIVSAISQFNVPRGTNSKLITFKHIFRGIFIAFLFMMLFDHYFWDIQQGMALFWIILALV